MRDDDSYTTWTCPHCHNYFGRGGKCSVCGTDLVRSNLSDAEVNRRIKERDLAKDKNRH